MDALSSWRSMFMKRIELGIIVAVIGCINWILVIGIFMISSYFPKGLLFHTLDSFMEKYLFASFIPALINIILTK